MRALCLVVCVACTPPAPAVVVEPVEPLPRGVFVFVTGRDADDHWSHSQIYLFDTNRAFVNLTNDANWNAAPAIAPDGMQMVFVSARKRAPQLCIMDLSNGESRELTSGEMGVATPHWLGHTIAYASPASTAGGAQVVWLTDDRGRSPRQLTSPSKDESDDGGLALIDGGRRVVFSRYDRKTQDRDLFVVSVEDGVVRRVTETRDVSEAQPALSHDGRLLAFRASQSRTYKESIRIISLRDFSTVADIPLPAPAHWNLNGIDFSADDRRLVFGADADDVGGSLQNIKGEIFSIAIDGTDLHRLTKNAAFDGQPAMLPGAVEI